MNVFMNEPVHHWFTRLIFPKRVFIQKWSTAMCCS